jgi:hypothetical protein
VEREQLMVSKGERAAAGGRVTAGGAGGRKGEAGRQSVVILRIMWAMQHLVLTV